MQASKQARKEYKVTIIKSAIKYLLHKRIINFEKRIKLSYLSNTKYLEDQHANAANSNSISQLKFIYTN